MLALSTAAKSFRGVVFTTVDESCDNLSAADQAPFRRICMPRMNTLEFTRMPAGRPGDAVAADETSSCAEGGPS